MFSSILIVLFSLCAEAEAASEPSQPARALDTFESIALWSAGHTDDVGAELSNEKTADGHALHLAFDFTGAHGQPVNGYATARRTLPLDLPENYEFRFRVRGNPSFNNLQFKLIDASGENVWWLNQPDFAFTPEWREIRVKRRHIEFAWGPTKDRVLRHAAAIEFVVSSGRDGGKGWMEIDRLSLRALPPQDRSPLRPRVRASSTAAGFSAGAAVDGDVHTAWRSDPVKGKVQRLDFDFGKPREVGGLVLRWRSGERAPQWNLQQSDDRRRWHSCAGAGARSGDDDYLKLCESEARYWRLQLMATEATAYGLNEVEFKDPEWAPTENAFFQRVAQGAPRGTFPRGFTEQPYWTILGVDGGATPALISEDGAVEPRVGRYSIEPFLSVDGRTLSWADVTSEQSLADGYLPMPRVHWNSAAVQLTVDAFAQGEQTRSQLLLRYRVRNTSAVPVAAVLHLAIRPLQVNPPAQFLNAAGGVGSIQALHRDGALLRIDDAELRALTPPDDFVVTDISRNVLAPTNAPGAYDTFGRAAAELVYTFQLPPGAERRVDIVAALSGRLPEDATDAPEGWFEQRQSAVADAWRARLDRVHLHVPPSAQYLADALRTAHAQILMSRDGAALRPGTRSYARSWIRDGAMIADALLRLGDIQAVREYVEWYTPHQFSDGKVPCCVDRRGSDPVPENDSEGEFIHLIAQLYRYSGDRAELQHHWPRIEQAIAYMDRLRATQTGADDPAFRALMPASISHEGYSAKPEHSYWDDFWALTGYNDAADMAGVLHNSDAIRYAQTRDAFRTALFASIALAVKAHAIDFIPGCAELGDFDATSTTVALSPANEQENLPQDLLHNTFDRYWREFAARGDGSKPWEDYTPYEWRTVGAFVRLGWRARAQAAIKFFFDTGARPAGWNQWAEVVGRDPRKIRFIGDMPHAWVASDFIRSVLDLFAYERAGDRSLMLAAGAAPDWIAAHGGIGIDGLRTAYGTLSYRLRREGTRLALHIDPGPTPPGGFVLPWPFDGTPGATRINGKPAAWQDDGLHIATAPADVTVEAAH